MGHHYNPERKINFVSAHVLPQKVSTYINSTIYNKALNSGQPIILYEGHGQSSIHIKPATIEGKVIASNKKLIIQPLTLDGKRYEQFASSLIEIQQKEISPIVGDYIRIKTHLTPTTETSLETLEEEVLSMKNVEISLDFSINNTAQIFHEKTDEGNGQLFFLDSLNDTRITANLVDSAISTEIKINEIQTTETTSFSLTYQEGDLNSVEKLTDLDQLMEKISPLLNNYEQKLFSLNAKGTHDEGKFVATSLHLYLQTPLAHSTPGDDFWEKDAVTDLSTMHEDDKAVVKENKTPIGAIVGGSLAGVAGILLVAGSLRLNYLIKKDPNLAGHIPQWAGNDSEFTAYSELGSGITTVYNFTSHKFSVYHQAIESDRIKAKAIPGDLDTEQLILIGDKLIDPDKGDVLPLKWNSDNKQWHEDSSQDDWRSVAHDLAGFEDVTIESKKGIYRCRFNKGPTFYTPQIGLYTLGSALKEIPKTTNSQFYFKSDTNASRVLGIHKQGSNKKNSPTSVFKLKSLYRPDLMQTDKKGKFKDWPIIADDAIKKRFSEIPGLEKQYNDEYGERNRKSPKELRVYIQLENDSYAINQAIYRKFMRYPDHSILVQMNKEGDFRITNGIDNLAKFAQPEFRDKVIWNPFGHGSEYSHGGHSVKQLTNSMQNLLNKLPDAANKAYSEKFNRPLSISTSAITPNHINMDGCSLGRSHWYTNSFMQKFADSFYKKTQLSPTYESISRIGASSGTGQAIVHPSVIKATGKKTDLTADTGLTKQLFSSQTDNFTSEKDFYEKGGHKIYDPAKMSKPQSSQAIDGYYTDSRGKNVRILRGRSESANNMQQE